MKGNQTFDSNEPSQEALFRYQVISQVIALKQQGLLHSSAIDAIAAEIHYYETGKPRKISSRTLYRWLNAFEAKGFKGLIPAVRKQTALSRVISEELLIFFKQQKEKDPKAALPELIRRAKQLDLVTDESEVDRTTLWRTLKRMGVDTTRLGEAQGVRNKRRFSYPHRMDMVLCDGKHFRAGEQRLRRVALFFLDDATRFVLTVVVGTSESSELFLRGVFETLLRYGTMRSLYTDHGSGFVAGDCISVMQQLKILFVQGEVGYKEGRGKVERFNRTVLSQCLRYLDGDPRVNTDCAALELRLRHYISDLYNPTPHEGIGNQTPWERFHSDSRVLCFKKSRDELQRAFVLHRKRHVADDNIVSFGGVKYDMPHGYAKQNVILRHHLLENKLGFIHHGKEICLHPVDLHANATEPRSKAKIEKKNPEDFPAILPDSSAQIAFNKEYEPIVDSGGGFSQPLDQEKT